ncbi:C40 family peptidase [Sutcliffiella rhizosphaerae]|uniref:Gamma-D-glutamyl-L-lysine dipeptidyl-peptidase n=1 Tax=Sutcliffiella rhizosphaerae TaxID=2880967 RepID=A0ABM8YT29_9BACI|nr:C40 family peptidase [Sutcliffiella rhizosphaerae]CAG9622944.1 Gamma-D-glutamyl-L-lysine dipeptidyl-peptidase [Sutcliffiella rhizosphaerae]
MTNQKIHNIIKTGKSFIGTSYLFGAESGRTDRFDCSSFIQYIYGQHGIILPRTSRQQFICGQPVPLPSVKRGDLLFFSTPKRKKRKGIQKVGHVAVFIGNNSILHTSRVETKVSVSSLSPNWRKRLLGARRVIV